MKAPKRTKPLKRLGIWLVGARGGLATTVVTGAYAMARGLTEPIGLLTETPLLDGLGFAEFDDIVFGGHDIRRTKTRDAALEVAKDSGTISPALIEALAQPFRSFDREVRDGTCTHAGKAIEALADEPLRADTRSVREIVDALRGDLASFKRRKKLERVVVVNLSSTEPPLRVGKKHRTAQSIDDLIDSNDVAALRPSLLYAYAAARESCPFIHFTPSNATLVAGIREHFDATKTPYMGSDGKTGETLVKSALAPMFKYRNLRVLSWLGYNLLGDRDGAILGNDENKRSKVATKDSLLRNILGYDLRSHVAIDYVESLGDQKTAWDYIHFEGFLGFKMHMQFTWHGCDSVLAAPLILDMARLADLAADRGECGALQQLACFFKRPVDCEDDDLHGQWHALERYAIQLSEERDRVQAGSGQAKPRKARSSRARRKR